MTLGGFQKFSLSDFPGRISAILFTQGCNFRCPYCHNPELVDPGAFAEPLEEECILGFLESRKSSLQGIVVTGGEPTLHMDLPGLLQKLKNMGYEVKLDTNGSNPDMLRTLIDSGLLDYCAMDIKAPLLRYPIVIRTPVDPEKILSSIELLADSGIEIEFRTTFVEPLLSPADLISIVRSLKKSSRLILQRFHPTKTLDPLFLEYPETSESRLEEARILLAAEGLSIELR